MKDDIKNLLVLQDKDAKIFDLNSKIAAALAKIAECDKNIEQQKNLMGEFERKVGDLQNQRMSLRAERKAVEDRILKYKTQLLSVKKNDEYTALNAAIDKSGQEVSAFEEKELEIMFEIDEIAPKLEAEKQSRQKNIDEINSQKNLYAEQIENLKAALENAQIDRRRAETNVSPKFLTAYEAVLKSKKRLPVIAYVDDSRCSGCHLKISSDLETMAKLADNPVFCEHCGRLIYVYS